MNREVKTLGDAIGMPDDVDKAFIRRIILEYERENPGLIKHAIDEARKDQSESSMAFDDKRKFGLVDKQSSRRHLLELPEGLMQQFERYYPTLFREKKHFTWFCKNFKELMLPEKY